MDPKIPWKAILLAVALFLGGTLFLVLGCLLVSGQIDAKVLTDIWTVCSKRTYPYSVIFDFAVWRPYMALNSYWNHYVHPWCLPCADRLLRVPPLRRIFFRRHTRIQLKVSTFLALLNFPECLFALVIRVFSPVVHLLSFGPSHFFNIITVCSNTVWQKKKLCPRFGFVKIKMLLDHVDID